MMPFNRNLMWHNGYIVHHDNILRFFRKGNPSGGERSSKRRRGAAASPSTVNDVTSASPILEQQAAARVPKAARRKECFPNGHLSASESNQYSQSRPVSSGIYYAK